MTQLSADPSLADEAVSRPNDALLTTNDIGLSPEWPFPGLRPFAFVDRSFFFGRESQAFALYRLVQNGRFVAVVGSSGSGKSSLVRAGLCGLLDEETKDPNGRKWICLDMQPRGAPIKRLANTLAHLGGLESTDDRARRMARVEYRLGQSSFGFESALTEAGGLGGRELLLIVDQFEELFRFGLMGLRQRQTGAEEARARDEAIQFVQVLLDASRRLASIHIMITMRSDFIGDCSYFRGLPEAVSALQYLVPNLDRDQLEDVIRKPIELAHATIEPELVQQLINDSGEELDQLPILQHCLMRLWDRAGGPPRRLTRQTYDDIGRIAEALSHHADEVLGECSGKKKELAVEQAFRALSERDREDRAVRRALRFDKLLAETGVDEVDLRDVLDRFRAPTCSFLVPPPSVAPYLAADDRVDVGHEALLRQWKKLAGNKEGVARARPARSWRAPLFPWAKLADEKPMALAGDAPLAPGWLAAEQADGQRYRFFVSLLDTEKASLKEPEETKRWWDSRPRTSAWADRYGDRFSDVKQLIDDNIAAKHWRQRFAWSLAAIIVALLAALALIEIQSVKRQRQATDQGATAAAKTLIEEVRDAFQKGTLNLAGARSIAAVSENFVRKVREPYGDESANPTWIELLEVEADLQTNARENAKALELATEAKDSAFILVKSSPNDTAALQQLYGALIREGDAQSGNFALPDYKFALLIAEKSLSLAQTDSSNWQVADAHLKIGDISVDNRKYDDALREYRVAKAICEEGRVKFPSSFVLIREDGATNYRMAVPLQLLGLLDAAVLSLQSAEIDQTALIERATKDPKLTGELGSLKSNLAATYSLFGSLAAQKGDLETALSRFQRGIAIQEELHKLDPGNPLWANFLAPNYKNISIVLEKLKRPREAVEYYQRAFDLSRDLAIRGLDKPELLVRFAEAAKSLGDHSTGLARIDAYRAATRAWDRLLDSTIPSTLTGRFDEVEGFAAAFYALKDWPDVATAYHVAAKMARAQQNFAKDDPSLSASWKEKAEAGDKAAADAQAAGAAALQPAALPQ